MTLDTYALIQNELERRGIPALIQSHRKRGYIVIQCARGAKLEFTDVDPTLSCQLIDHGRVMKNFETDIPSDTTEAKVVADWIASIYTKRASDQQHADALRNSIVTEARDGEGEDEHGVTSVVLTPNFGHLVRQFVRDSMIHAGILERSTDPQVVSAFRGFVVSLNIAVQALESAESVQFVREELDKLRERIVARDERMMMQHAGEEFQNEN